jgi:hypothetical protein
MRRLLSRQVRRSILGQAHLGQLPSPALVVACLALLVALGGTGYAAFKLPAGSVGAKQLKKGAVVNKKLAKNAVTGAKVKDDSLTGAEVKDDSLTGADLLESSLGKVPAAGRADSAANAANATHATTAGSATAASALNGYHANGLTRVAETTAGGLPVTLAVAEKAFGPALSITAPAPGFVLLTGSVHMHLGSACTSGCSAHVDLEHTQTATGWGDYASLFAETDQQIPLSRVFPVAAGVNTFGLSVWRLPGNGTLQASLGSLTAIYSPFGSTGGSTLGGSK